MIKRYTQSDEVWIDIDQGTPEEIERIMDEYKVHPLVARELAKTTRKPKVEFHNDYIYCILHFPARKHSHSEDQNQEVDFIIGKKVLITVRYDSIDHLHTYSKSLEVKEVLEKSEHETNSLFTGLLSELYSGVFDELENTEDESEAITEKIFLGQEKNMVVEISKTTRVLLDFKKVIELHKDVLENLQGIGTLIFGRKFEKQFESIMLQYMKIQSTINSNLEILRELRDTNNSLLYSKQNETIKKLTAMGFVILPLNLIAWIFAMRTGGLPLVDNPNGFIMVLVMMITSILVTMLYAKSKKWL